MSTQPTAAARAASGGVPRLADLSDLPPTLDLTTAARLLGIGRSTAYALVRDDRFPCPTFKAGHQHRVATAVLLRLLGIAVPEPDQPETPLHSE
ncbi:helix-turn-helix domain-containing protein [Streptacidiphilus neutrinimicus]|uniref:helix-turn-helix domain-containing protein n=1 Tax=Streptacidiphilus neutrinimicus TaxID=105420 RepID=UPI0005AA55F3|nr:helix-turn-helix domain-containing protein [Streptacidiphilus neutrinimicus]